MRSRDFCPRQKLSRRFRFFTEVGLLPKCAMTRDWTCSQVCHMEPQGHHNCGSIGIVSIVLCIVAWYNSMLNVSLSSTFKNELRNLCFHIHSKAWRTHDSPMFQPSEQVSSHHFSLNQFPAGNLMLDMLLAAPSSFVCIPGFCQKQRAMLPRNIPKPRD